MKATDPNASTLKLVPSAAGFQSHFQPTSQALTQSSLTTASPSPLGYVPPPVHISGLHAGMTVQSAAVLPASYDLRTTGKLTAVRDQGNCGSCWTFATYAAAESQLLPGETDDFSEEHLNDWSGFDVGACNGGNSAMSIAYLSRWAGPVAETADPYTAGASKTINKSAPAVKHLQSALTIADRTGSLDNGGIKAAVMSYGGVMTTMLWNNAGWNGGTNSYYLPSPGYYANHAVTIVGWNDTYPASKFSQTPPGNGAFIIRNSWGTSFGESGYFYISYYDPYIGMENNVYDVLAATTDFTAVYQYDQYGVTATLSGSGATYYQSNIYTANANATIAAIGFYTLLPSTSVDVSIWSSPVGANPASGARIGNLTGVVEALAGYHTVSVASLGAQAQSGQKFSVVLRVTSAKQMIPIEYPYAGYSSKVTVRVGTSFFGSDGASGVSWTDVGAVYGANMPVKVFVGAAATGSCDDGNPCTTDSGTPGNCTHKPVAAGTVCRAAAGPCDVAEVCNGTAAACPGDKKAVQGTACASKGACSATPVCDGSSAACPAAVPAAKGTVCRAAAGACDVAETCDGTATTCPADGWAASTTVCRAAAGACDAAETCTGTSAACPVDSVQPQTFVCHAAVSACDSTVTCNGTSKTCAAAQVKPAGTVCRAAASSCDTAQVCDGRAATCPANNATAKTLKCPAPSAHAAAFTGSDLTAQVGNTAGGTAYNDACPTGQVLTGFAGSLSLATSSAVNRQITGHCGIVQIAGTTVTVTAGAILPTRGKAGASSWTSDCPANQAVVGFSGHSGLLVDQIALRCAPLLASAATSGSSLAVGTTTSLTAMGGTGGSAFAAVSCPTGEVSTMARIRVGDNMDAFGLACAKGAIGP
jgi:C1A family cysteine protease